MKYILLLLFTLLIYSSSFAQKHEFSLGYRIGLDIGDNKNYNSVLKSSFDQGVTLQFKYRIWEKAKLYAVLGYDKSTTKYNIHNELFGKPKKPLKFNTVNVNRDAIHFGLSKKFSMNKYSLNIGLVYVTRIKAYRNISGSASGGFYEFEETTRTFHFETSPDLRDRGFELNLSFMYDLSEKFSVNTGFTLSYDHYLSYKSSAKFVDASGNYTTMYSQTYFEADNFVFLNAGFVYKL